MRRSPDNRSWRVEFLLGSTASTFHAESHAARCAFSQRRSPPSRDAPWRPGTSGLPTVRLPRSRTATTATRAATMLPGPRSRPRTLFRVSPYASGANRVRRRTNRRSRSCSAVTTSILSMRRPVGGEMAPLVLAGRCRRDRVVAPEPWSERLPDGAGSGAPTSGSGSSGRSKSASAS